MGRSTGCSACLFVAPITWPVFMPPPARIAQLAWGQWSRLFLLFNRGVRPNSPQTTTETSLSRPRSCKSVNSDERPPAIGVDLDNPPFAVCQVQVDFDVEL